MSELPQPDLLDKTGRLRRLVIAFLVGLAAAAAAYAIAVAVIEPDSVPAAGGSMARAYSTVYYATGLAGGACFLIALVLQNHLAKQRWRRERVPRAEIR